MDDDAYYLRHIQYTDFSFQLQYYLYIFCRNSPCGGNSSVKMLALSGLWKHYPKDPLEKFNRRLAALLLGVEIATKAYGPLAKKTP